jgi:hypothetical protein
MCHPSTLARAKDGRGESVMAKARWRRLAFHFGRVLLRALIATAMLWILVSLPLPRQTPELFYIVRVPVLVFFFIVYLGKLLIDTLFYNHYQQ